MTAVTFASIFPFKVKTFPKVGAEPKYLSATRLVITTAFGSERAVLRSPSLDLKRKKSKTFPSAKYTAFSKRALSPLDTVQPSKGALIRVTSSTSGILKLGMLQLNELGSLPGLISRSTGIAQSTTNSVTLSLFDVSGSETAACSASILLVITMV